MFHLYYYVRIVFRLVNENGVPHAKYSDTDLDPHGMLGSEGGVSDENVLQNQTGLSDKL